MIGGLKRRILSKRMMLRNRDVLRYASDSDGPSGLATRPVHHQREVIQVIVEIAPGVTAPEHTHPGEEIIYVLEGTLEYEVEGKPPVTRRTSAPATGRNSPRISSRKGSHYSQWSSERLIDFPWKRLRQGGEL